MNAREYWNKKILKWERTRYSGFSHFIPSSWSVRARLQVASDVIGSFDRKVAIVDLGCGGGELARKLSVDKVASYIGYDISDLAIEKANGFHLGPAFRFVQQDVEQISVWPMADISVALGLTDWIGKDSLVHLLTSIKSENVLISYTDSVAGWRSSLYSIYRQYRDRSAFQTVRYSDDEFAQVCRLAGWRVSRDFTTSSMRPGRLLWLQKDISM